MPPAAAHFSGSFPSGFSASSWPTRLCQVSTTLRFAAKPFPSQWLLLFLSEICLAWRRTTWRWKGRDCPHCWGRRTPRWSSESVFCFLWRLYHHPAWVLWYQPPPGGLHVQLCTLTARPGARGWKRTWDRGWAGANWGWRETPCRGEPATGTEHQWHPHNLTDSGHSAPSPWGGRTSTTTVQVLHSPPCLYYSEVK